MIFIAAWFKARPALLIVVLGLLLNLSGTWMLPLADRDEPRFAEASREMLERGDWVVPWCEGAPRYDKPPLIYWAQMISFRCLGENAFAARLPTALFATGSALLIYIWARRWAKRRTALVAAVIFLTCVQMAIHGRLAVADMPMIFFTTAALWSGWEFTRPAVEYPWRWWWVFFVSLALGFLAKGPVAWLPVIGLWLGAGLQPKQFSLQRGHFALGMLLALGIVGIWGVPALIRTHGEFLYVGLGHHVVYRSFGVLEGHGVKGWIGWVASSPFFLAGFFFSFFPWAFWFPRALKNWWPVRQRDIFGWYLMTQAAVVFVVFTIVRTKLPHYTLPAFPCLAIWLAKMEQDGILKNLHAGRIAAFMAALIVAVTLGLGVYLTPQFLSHSLFEEARSRLLPGMAIATVDYTEPSLAWEFRSIVTNQVETVAPELAAQYLRQTRPAILVVPTAFYETNLSRCAPQDAIVQVKGINFTKFSVTRLTAIIQP